MMNFIESFLFFFGSLFIFLAAFGIRRLPDSYCRIHALAKANCLGISLMLIGLWLSADTGTGDFRILLAIFFQFLLIPISGHLVTQLGMQLNIPRWKHRPVKLPDVRTSK